MFSQTTKGFVEFYKSNVGIDSRSLLRLYKFVLTLFAVCKMFNWRPQNPGVYMTRRKYSKNNKNGTILVRNNMRKFAEMKSSTEMSLTIHVLKANILIEFSFWFDLVRFSES